MFPYYDPEYSFLPVGTTYPAYLLSFDHLQNIWRTLGYKSRVPSLRNLYQGLLLRPFEDKISFSTPYFRILLV